jgi:hypothetical protein
MPRTNELTLLPKLPLLITESADEFDALRDAFEQEIKPRGIIEQMYVHDVSSIVWEILRLRRCKVVIINSAFRSALQDLLMRRKLLRRHGSPIKRRNKALGCVAEYRASLGRQLRESADRIIDGKDVLRLEDAASNRSTAA